jgi:preprotein translocase subunit YajC
MAVPVAELASTFRFFEWLSLDSGLLAQEGAQNYSWVGLMVMIGVMFYMLIVRPEQKRRKDQERDLKELKKNDRIVTVGGILGTVVNVVKDDEVVIRVDEQTNTKMHILRSAVSRILKEEKTGDKE